jgi:hypothetical protein
MLVCVRVPLGGYVTNWLVLFSPYRLLYACILCFPASKNGRLLHLPHPADWGPQIDTNETDIVELI